MSPEQINREKNGTNALLVQALGGKRGYDPMPPDQHEWQGTEGQPTIYRLWSWMCAHTIRARYLDNKQFRTAYATQDDGVTPLGLAQAAKDLDIDLGQISNTWKQGEEAGLWRRDGQTRRLYLNGEVSAAQVLKAKEQRKVECTLNLTPADLLRIKELPKAKQEWFLERWKPAQDYGAAHVAAAVAEARESWSALNDSILRAVGIEKKRIGRTSTPAPAVPQLLFEFVHSTSEHSNRVESSYGEDVGETLSAHDRASLLSSEKPSEELLGVGPSVSSVRKSGTDRPTKPPAGSAPETPSHRVHTALAIQQALIETLGKKLPRQVPSDAVCGLIAAFLEAPLQQLQLACHERRDKFTSYGLAASIAREVQNAWREGSKARQRDSSAASEREARLNAEHARMHQEHVRDAEKIMRDPNANEESKEWAREVLGANTHAAAGGAR